MSARRGGASGALPDAREPLSPDEAGRAFDALLDGRVGDAEIARFLVELADRGETVDEVVAAARALRARMLPVEAPEGAIDVCGTGGDGRGSLNVSTAVAIVVAACGVPVAKHGNRAASSRSGAADVLGALGLDLDKPPAFAEACVGELGIAFLFAANHHPAMARVAGVRRALGRRTVFNLLGPLANPAEVKRQLVGVFAAAWVGRLSDALSDLGAEASMIVHGADGLDEISVSGPTHVVVQGIRPVLDAAWPMDADVARLPSGREPPLPTDTRTRGFSLRPETAGVPLHARDAITGGDAAHNAAALACLLGGERGAYRDIVLLNAAAALIVAERAAGWRTGAALAAEAIDSGAARDLLARWIAFR